MAVYMTAIYTACTGRVHSTYMAMYGLCTRMGHVIGRVRAVHTARVHDWLHTRPVHRRLRPST